MTGSPTATTTPRSSFGWSEQTRPCSWTRRGGTVHGARSCAAFARARSASSYRQDVRSPTGADYATSGASLGASGESAASSAKQSLESCRSTQGMLGCTCSAPSARCASFSTRPFHRRVRRARRALISRRGRLQRLRRSRFAWNPGQPRLLDRLAQPQAGGGKRPSRLSRERRSSAACDARSHTTREQRMIRRLGR